eukprot:4048466-Alexandrium_andersonii.AAC.1
MNAPRCLEHPRRHHIHAISLDPHMTRSLLCSASLGGRVQGLIAAILRSASPGGRVQGLIAAILHSASPGGRVQGSIAATHGASRGEGGLGGGTLPHL